MPNSSGGISGSCVSCAAGWAGSSATSVARSRASQPKGYRGHDAQNPRRVFISGQKRGVFGVIKRELRRRSAIEPIIGHMKTEGHLGRCYLKAVPETPPTSSSQPSARTSAVSSPGSENSCACSWSDYGACWPVQPRSIRLLNGRRLRPEADIRNRSRLIVLPRSAKLISRADTSPAAAFRSGK
jgi:hypothetical protein